MFRTHPGLRPGQRSAGNAAAALKRRRAYSDGRRTTDSSEEASWQEVSDGRRRGSPSQTLFGAHLSIAGGLQRAAEAAATLGCDTCHVFAAGYDLSTPAGYADAFAAFDQLIGLDRLKLFHLNDSVKGLGKGWTGTPASGPG